MSHILARIVNLFKLHDTGRGIFNTGSHLADEELQQPLGNWRHVAHDQARALVEHKPVKTKNKILSLKRDAEQGEAGTVHVRFRGLGISTTRPAQIEQRNNRISILDVAELLYSDKFQQSEQDLRWDL